MGRMNDFALHGMSIKVSDNGMLTLICNRNKKDSPYECIVGTNKYGNDLVMMIHNDDVVRLIEDLNKVHKDVLYVDKLNQKKRYKKMGLKFIELSWGEALCRKYAKFEYDSNIYYAIFNNKSAEYSDAKMMIEIFNGNSGRIVDDEPVDTFGVNVADKYVLLKCIEYFCEEMED